MSIKMMALIWDSQMPTSTHKLVLLAFADHANDNGGSCFPSIRKVAIKTQISQRQVQRIVADLKLNGLLIAMKPPRGHKTPSYQIRGDRMTPLRCDDDTGVASGVTDEPARGDTHDAAGVTPMSPKSSGEPSLEPSGETAAAARASSEIFDLYELHIGPFNPFIAAILAEAESDYTEGCIRHAFQEASRQNARRWVYVEAILKAHKQEGCYVRRPKASRRGAQGSEAALRRPEEETEKWRVYAAAD